MSATDFFAVMDFNRSGTLTREKFLEFWRRLKREGISDDEIIVQLEMTKMKEMWIGFEPSIIKEVALSDAKKIDNSVEEIEIVPNQNQEEYQKREHEERI